MFKTVLFFLVFSICDYIHANDSIIIGNSASSFEQVFPCEVVVNVWVNQIGVVVEFFLNEDETTCVDESLLRKAEKAACEAIFSPNPHGLETQKGRMVFKFL